MRVFPTRSRPRFPRVCQIEPLESRIAPATIVSLTSGTLTVTGDSGAAGQSEQLNFTISGGNLLITDGGAQPVTANGPGVTQAQGNQVSVVLSSITADFTVNTGTGADSLIFSNAMTLPGHFSATDGGTISFLQTLTLAADKNLTVNAAGTITLANATSDLATSGAGTISLTTARDIVLDPGSSVTVANGDVALKSNLAGAAAGTFVGINLDGADLTTTGSGAISLSGTGGKTGDGNTGILVQNNAHILSTGTTATAGTITLTGNGGNANAANHGLLITGANTLISSVSGAIQITGTGFGAGVGNNSGVTLDSNAQITSTGSGATAASITINGTGGGGGGNDNGVLVATGGKISAHGPMLVIGTEGAGANSEGIAVVGAGSTITSTADFTLLANNINLDPANAVISTPLTVELAPRVAGTAIDLGGPDVAATKLGLTNAELNRITAVIVNIGDFTQIGTINVSAALNLANSLSLVTQANVTSAAGAITLAAGKDLSVTGNGGIDLGALTVPGTTTLAAGAGATISASNSANALATVVITSGGSVSLRDDGGFNIGGANISTLLTLQTNGTITQSGGVIAGAGGLTMQGGGQLQLSAANSYAGATTLTSGVLKLMAPDVIPDGAGKGDVSVNIGAQFDLNGFSETIDGLTGNGAVTNSSATPATLTIGGNNATTGFTGAITGNLALAKIGSGTFTLSGANNYTGSTTITAGSLKLGGAGVIPDTSTVVVNGGTFDLTNGINETVGGFTLTGGGTLIGASILTSNTTFDLQAGSVNSTLAGNVGIIVSTGGTVTFTAPGTYTGATEIRDGTLKLSGAALPIGTNLSLGDATNHSGVLDLNNVTQEVAGLTTVGSGAGNRVIDSTNDAVIPALRVNLAGTSVFGGILGGVNAGGFAVTKAGAGLLVLSGNNTYSGGTTINTGVLQVGNGGASGSLGSGVVNGAGAGTGTLVFNRDDSLNISNVISGALAVTQAGIGTVDLLATDTYSGPTAVTSGTLTVGGTLANTASVSVSLNATLGGAGTINNAALTTINGTLGPGAGGFALKAGSLTLANGATFQAQLNPGAAGHSEVDVAGTVTLGGARLSTSGNVTSQSGQQIVLVKNNSGNPVVGKFNGLNEGDPVTINGVLFHITYVGGGGNDVILAQPVIETEVTLAVTGDLVVTDIVAGGHDDTLTITPQAATGAIVISDPSHILTVTGIPTASVSLDLHTVTVPSVAITGPQIIVNTLAGDDVVTIDVTQTLLTKTVNFDGGTQAVTGDRLVLAGATFSSATFDFTDAQSGAVTLPGNSPINYLGLEGVSSAVPTAKLTLNYNSNGVNTVTVVDGGSGKTTVTSAAGATLSIVNPSITLAINGGSKDDTIKINSLSNFPGNLAIDGKTGTDSVNLAAGLPTLGGLTVTTENLAALPTLTLGAGGLDITTTASAIDIGGGITTTGPVKLTSGGAITNSAGIIASAGVTASAVGGIMLAIDGGTFNATNTGIGGVTVKTGANAATITGLDPGLGVASLTAGTFNLAKTDTITSGASLAVGGTLDLQGSNQTINGLTSNGTVTNSAAALSTLTLGAGDATATFNGNINGHIALTKIGAGTQIISGPDTATDGTKVAAGTLQFDAFGSALNGPFTLAGGTLFYNLSATLSTNITITNSSTIGVGAGQIVALTSPITGPVAGTPASPGTPAILGTLTKSGDGILIFGDQFNDFGPARVKITGGTLQVATDGALGDVANDVEINNAIFASTAAFASARNFTKASGAATATIDAQAPSLTLLNKATIANQATLSSNANVNFTFSFTALPATAVPGNAIVVGNTSVSLAGKGALTIHKLNPTTIDTIELIGSDSTTKLVIKGVDPSMITQINHIVIDDPDANKLGSIGSIVLGKNVRLGDPTVRDSVPELFVEGTTGTLQLYDLNQYALIHLGDGLPHGVTTDKKTPSSKTNHPNLTIHEVRGPGVLVDLTPSDLPLDIHGDAVGGGGLGKVVVNKWIDAGAIRTTQSIGSFKLNNLDKNAPNKSAGDCLIVFQLDKYGKGSDTAANCGSMTIQNGSWGSSGSEIEGGVGSFNANAFLAGATLTCASMGKFSLDAGAFAGLLRITDPDGAGIPTFTVNSDFTGTVNSAAPLQKIKVKGDFMGDLRALFIGSISAYSFFDGAAPTAIHTINATAGGLGTLTATAGVVKNFNITTDHVFKGFNVKLGKLTTNTAGIDNVHIQAASIGNITVSLAAAAGAAIDLTGICDSVFVTTANGATKPDVGSIGNISVTLTGAAPGTGGSDGTGIKNSTFDALVTANEFPSDPAASTVNVLGKIVVKVTGQDGASIGLDHATFSANSIGGIAVSVSKGKNGTAAHAIETANFTAKTSRPDLSGTIGAIAIDGDALTSQVHDLKVSADASVGAVTVKAKTTTLGTLDTSFILAGQALDMTGSADLTTRLARAALGAVNVTGSIVNTKLIAGGSIGAVTTGANLTGSLVLAGAKLGGDFVFNNNEDYQRTAAIAAITVHGNFASTSIAAGVNPGSGTFGLGAFGDGDTAATNLAGTSSIGPIVIFGNIPNDTASIVSHQFAIEAGKITSLKIGTGAVRTVFSPALFLDTAMPSNDDSSDVVVKVV